MFIDARTLPEVTEIASDICIVGAGPAGITLAREFAGTSTEVLLIESGGFEFDKETQSLCRGKNIGFPYYDLDILRLRRFGGSSQVWAGACRPLDEIDFLERSSLPYSGWPFDKSHLDPFYQRAHEVCQLGPYNYEPDMWETDRVKRFPTRDDHVVTTMYQSNAIRFGDTYRDEIGHAPNIRTYLFANAVDIETNSEGNAVTSVRAATLNGNRLTVSARAFVLAAGGIENARLMLASDRVHTRGLGNDNDLVGRFFMEHLSVPGAVLLTSDPEIDAGLYSGRFAERAWAAGYLAPSHNVIKNEGLLNARAFVQDTTPDEAMRKSSSGVVSAGFMWNAMMAGDAADSFTRHLQNVIADLDDVLVYGYLRAFRPAKGLFTLINHIEHAPNRNSRVTLSPERDKLGMRQVELAWQFGELERETLRRTNHLIGLEVGRAGLGRVKVMDDEPDTGWPPGVRGAWHQMGTTRMDRSPKRGVVDENCCVHGVANLFIAGSSVFPTSGYTNPTLTIVALALRLADHLKRVLQ